MCNIEAMQAISMSISTNCKVNLFSCICILFLDNNITIYTMR